MFQATALHQTSKAWYRHVATRCQKTWFTEPVATDFILTARALLTNVLLKKWCPSEFSVIVKMIPGNSFNHRTDANGDWPLWGILAMGKQADCGLNGCVRYALAWALSTDKRPLISNCLSVSRPSLSIHLRDEALLKFPQATAVLYCNRGH